MPPLYLDLTHTSHTRARTGIQRVARTLRNGLGSTLRPICHDPYNRAWRPLEAWEEANLSALTQSDKRSTRWPLQAKVRGTLRRLFSARREPIDLSGCGAFLEPEVFSTAVASALPGLLSKVTGPRGGIFHDAIPLTHPELTSPRTVARFSAYLQELACFDGVAAVSEASRGALIGYWQWVGFQNPPPVAAIPLGIDSFPGPAPRPPQAVSEILSIGTIEGRKNHVALLEACERLWARGMRFNLKLIGLAQGQTGGAALRRIKELQGAGRPLIYLGAADDSAREEAYSTSSFTVYPSLAEGFGLPVAESLAHGLPCICSGRGALGEIAQGGGCLTADVADPAELAAAIESLLSDPAKQAALAEAARERPVRTCTDYCRDVEAWIRDLPRSASRATSPGHSIAPQSPLGQQAS